MISEKVFMEIISKTVQPKESNIAESEDKAMWFPVLQSPALGLLGDGVWVLDTKNGLYILNHPDNFWPLVSLLEQSSNNLRREIIDFLDALNIEINPDDFFPFVEIVRAGFEFGTNYWAEMAFKWYDEMPYEKKERLKESLLKLETAKWTSQKLRHKVIKESKKIRIDLGNALKNDNLKVILSEAKLISWEFSPQCLNILLRTLDEDNSIRVNVKTDIVTSGIFSPNEASSIGRLVVEDVAEILEQEKGYYIPSQDFKTIMKNRKYSFFIGKKSSDYRYSISFVGSSLLLMFPVQDISKDISWTIE